ncbi:MAG: enoyl-CoA hydratase/isomerase family protein [Sporichthyaceae bacterium]
MTTTEATRVSADVLDAGDVLLETTGPVATVTLNRPDRRNAMSPSLWAALAAVPDHLPPEVRVVVLRGAGKVFCAGIDLRMVTADGVPGETSLGEVVTRDDSGVLDWIANLQRAYSWLGDPRWITIAAVQGAAVGGGFQLALAADMRVLSQDARLCMKETALGLVPDLTGTQTLLRAVGYPRALELCATARWVDAAEADRLGLANAVVPLEELDAATATLCEQVLVNSPAAVRGVKDLLIEAWLRTPAAAHEAERRTQVSLLRSVGAATQ